MTVATIALTTFAQRSGGPFVGAVMLIIALAGIATLILLWLWALVDCLRREFPGNEKIVWVLVIILLHLLGAVIYLAIGRQQGRLPRA